jgi:small conductance mechanosensitive channel
MDELKQILGQLTGYGELIATALAIMIGGMVAVLTLYKLAHALIKPGGAYARAMRVAFGAIYIMVLVVTILIAAERIGLPVHGLAGPAILIVLVISVIVFFIVPFLPRLPFVVGDMVQIKGVMGIVEAMTAYQVVIRSFDGQTVFMPTAIAMATPIHNYSLIPNRRIELNVDIYSNGDIEAVRSTLLTLMGYHKDVLADPAPSVFVTSVTGEKASMVAYCWVVNADWFPTRDALWVSVAGEFAGRDDVSLALPQMEISSPSDDSE